MASANDTARRRGGTGWAGGDKAGRLQPACPRKVLGDMVEARVVLTRALDVPALRKELRDLAVGRPDRHCLVPILWRALLTHGCMRGCRLQPTTLEA
eukprot:9477320-Pyramimonas_sp.AAC.1